MHIAQAYLESIDNGSQPMAFDATLHALEKDGFIEHYPLNGGIAYRITEAGKLYLERLRGTHKAVRILDNKDKRELF